MNSDNEKNLFLTLFRFHAINSLAQTPRLALEKHRNKRRFLFKNKHQNLFFDFFID